MATSTSVAEANREILERILYICYLIQFKKNEVQALLNSSNEINTITLAFALKLGLKIYHINIRTQKINSSIFKIFEMVLASF